MEMDLEKLTAAMVARQKFDALLGVEMGKVGLK